MEPVKDSAAQAIWPQQRSRGRGGIERRAQICEGVRYQ